MHKIIILLLCLRLAVGQFGNECGSDCRLISDCPELHRLTQIGGAENHKKVRDAICGFSERVAKVCCSRNAKETTSARLVSQMPATTTSKTTTTTIRTTTTTRRTTATTRRPPIPNPNGGSLLPKRCGHAAIGDRISSGNVTSIGAYPWMVALGYKEPTGDIEFMCAGSLINDRYVLTAAHCLAQESLGKKKLAILHLGDWNLGTSDDCQGTFCAPPHIAAGFEEVILHPQYNSRATSSDDVALIRLNVSIDFTTTKAYVQPICLPPKAIKPEVLAKGRSGSPDRLPIAAGWGITEHGTQSDVLLEAKLPLVNNKGCKDLWPDRFLESEQLCVGGTSRQDTCRGDSGGPLILSGPFGPPFLQIGIVSYGLNPCGIEYPGVYTSVGPYRDWIIENLNP